MTDKKPWEDFPQIWNTKAKFMAWLRGGIRRACWNRSPIKHEVIKKNRKRVMNEKTGNMVWGGECYLCGNDFLQKDLQVDHVIGENKLNDISDIQKFVESMTCLSAEDLSLVCVTCHKAKTYAEKHNIPFEEAVVEKRVIEIMKMPVKDLDILLAKHDRVCKNTKDRRDTIRELIKTGELG